RTNYWQLSFLFAGARNGFVNRFAPREAFLGAMPVSDALLTQFPTQQDYLSAYAAGEIEQTNVEVLDLHACGVDFGSGILNPLNRFFAFSFAPSQLDDVEQGAAIQKDAVRCVLELSVYFFDQLLPGNGTA